MNIIQIVPSLETGGVETGTIDLAKILLLEGHRPVVISAGGKLVKKLDELGIRHYELPVDRKSPFSVIRLIPRLIKIIRQEKADIVHARSRVPGWIAFFACYRTGAKFVTTSHGYYSTHLFSRVMGWGRAVIVPSQVIGRHMIDNFKVPADKIRLIHRGVDLDNFEYKPAHLRQKGTFTVGIIGRITPLKGHRYFLKAVAKTVRRIPRMRAVVVGDAGKKHRKYMDELMVLSRQLGISSYVDFVGRSSDVAASLSKLDALVMATTTPEAFGRVIIEANAVGVPVVSTQVGGAAEIVEDGINGLLVPAKDADSISESLIRLYKDKLLVRKLIVNGRKLVESKYTLDIMAKKTMEVYREAAGSLRILVIKLHARGDVILATPSIRSLRLKFPHAKISILVDLRCREIVENCPYVDEVLAYNIKDLHLASKKLWQLGSYLRSDSFDMVIDFQNNSKSHLLGFLSMSPRRYGYRNKKLGFLLNQSIKDTGAKIDPIRHQERVLHMLQTEIINKELELWPRKQDIEYINSFLETSWVAKGQILIALNLSASKRWQSKRWGLDNFVKLSDELTRLYNSRIIVIGSGEDQALAEEFSRRTKSRPIIATGKTSLMQLAVLLAKCKLLVTGDSAPMHIAAATKTPFIALFGPTDPDKHLPPAKKYKVFYANEKCAPCYKPGCSHLSCMKKIKAEDVLAAAREFLGAKR